MINLSTQQSDRKRTRKTNDNDNNSNNNNNNNNNNSNSNQEEVWPAFVENFPIFFLSVKVGVFKVFMTRIFLFSFLFVTYRVIHGCAGIWNFSLSVQLDISHLSNKEKSTLFTSQKENTLPFIHGAK